MLLQVMYIYKSFTNFIVFACLEMPDVWHAASSNCWNPKRLVFIAALVSRMAACRQGVYLESFLSKNFPLKKCRSPAYRRFEVERFLWFLIQEASPPRTVLQEHSQVPSSELPSGRAHLPALSATVRIVAFG